MSQILEKRTYDQVIYDFDCSQLLDASETITSVTEVISDQSGFTFGTPAINTQPVTYPDGTVAAVGKVIQVQISGGVIPAGRTELICMIRARFVTSINPALEATGVIRLTDLPKF